jgi:hypothetical protein
MFPAQTIIQYGERKALAVTAPRLGKFLKPQLLNVASGVLFAVGLVIIYSAVFRYTG